MSKMEILKGYTPWFHLVFIDFTLFLFFARIIPSTCITEIKWEFLLSIQFKGGKYEKRCLFLKLDIVIFKINVINKQTKKVQCYSHIMLFVTSTVHGHKYSSPSIFTIYFI